MQLNPGQRVPLASLTSSNSINLSIEIASPHVIDFVCFGLDAAGKLSDDRFMVFFNQPTAPGDAIKLLDGGNFFVNLDALPSTIDRLSFTASIDGPGVMSDIAASSFVVQAAGAEVASCAFSGATFSLEKAVMALDIYRKDGAWRLAVNLQGFNAGLDALVMLFGGEVAEPAPAPPAKISLEKKIADAAPALISLAKKAQVSLEKANLTSVKARVGLALDASGSMNTMYNRGRVQEVVDRIMPLAVHFDDDGALDCWAFAEKPQQLSPITLANYKNYIETDNKGWKKWNLGSRINDEPRVMRQIIDFYKKSGDKSPVYILFITDGGVHQNREITQLMIEAAKLPIHWVFVGLGGSRYGILEKLDDMGGRVVDNCNFFALDDLTDVTEEKLYDLLMEEFPQWLKDARAKGIIR